MARRPASLSQNSRIRMSWGLWGCECKPRAFSLNSRSRDTPKVGSTRLTSKSRVPEQQFETFEVTCGSSGRITVDVYNSHTLTKPSSPLIVYLPPTGVHQRHNYSPITSLLSSLHSTTALARINYRWNIPHSPRSSPNYPSPPPSPRPLSSSSTYNNYPFPTPLHDILHAFDFVTTSLPSSLPSSSSPLTAPHAAPTFPRKTSQRPLFIYGEFLGGTLATSLALTETYTSKNHPFRIAGLITKNAVFDWTPAATSKDPWSSNTAEDEPGLQARGQDRERIWDGKPWTSQTLHSLKSSLFASPQSAFDSFASPLLLFRTAGFSAPSRWPGTPPTPPPNTYSTSIISESELQNPMELRESLLEEAQKRKKREEEEHVETTRISHLKFPPRQKSNSGLKIPRSLFLASSPSLPTISQSPKSTAAKKRKPPNKQEEVSPVTQAEEMCRLMQRSVVMHEFKDRASWDEGLDVHSAAEERVQVIVGFNEREGLEGQRVREWIEESLD